MATINDLMGLGVPPAVARLLGNTPVTVTVSGTTLANAKNIGNPDTKFSVLTGGTSCLAIATVGTDLGPLLGDEINIFNDSGADVVLFARNSASFNTGNSSVAGATGITLSTSYSYTIRVYSTSQFFVGRMSV